MLVRPYALLSLLLIVSVTVFTFSYVSSKSETGLSNFLSSENMAPGVVSEEAVVPEEVAPPPVKMYIVRYNILDTPDVVVARAIKTMKSLGARVTHEFHTVMRGFTVSIPAALRPTEVLDAFKTQAASPDFPFKIEEDQPVRKYLHDEAD
ncbi:hypothetical protein V1512DRAFT_263096 [Lipomyces arxii]|uniref:uncharacterized protein n=1 Tax=Lipomyces arxii TaxID=56418 RepID=UPI0034CD4E6C